MTDIDVPHKKRSEDLSEGTMDNRVRVQVDQFEQQTS